jgi:uncharacterized integral membrane protein
MGLVRGIIFFLLLLVGIGFAIHNDQPVSLRYYFGWASSSLPLFLWAFLFLLCGLILSSLWAFTAKLSLHSRVRKERRALADLEGRRDRVKEEKRPL